MTAWSCGSSSSCTAWAWSQDPSTNENVWETINSQWNEGGLNYTILIVLPVRPKFRHTLLMLTDQQITLAHTTLKPTVTPPAPPPFVNGRTFYTC